MFFLWCCGPRQRGGDDDAERRAAQDVPPAETDWLLGGDPPTTYLDDGSDAESSEEEEFIHDVLREAEGKMVNVTHDDPLQIHANLSGIQYYLHHDGSGVDTPSHDDPYEYEPHRDDAHRGRRSDRRKRRAKQTNGAAATTSSRRARTNGNGDGDEHDPSRSFSRSNSRSGTDSRSRSSDYAYGYDENGYGGYYNVNDYEYSNGYDAPSGSHAYDSNGGPEDDSYSPGPDPEEEARLRRLRGPKLSARILPLPRRQIELDEEEERMRREEETFGGGGGGTGGEERTPVLERKGMDLGSGAGSNGTSRMNGNGVVPKGSSTVEPLNEEDERTITALGDALWKALEDDLKIAEAPKIMHGWDD